jgi:hypothetical protein
VTLENQQLKSKMREMEERPLKLALEKIRILSPQFSNDSPLLENDQKPQKKSMQHSKNYK